MTEQGRLVECKGCSFKRAVASDSDVAPADILFHHGRHTGHELRVIRIER